MAAVQVIREIVHPGFKSLARHEQLVFTTSHRRNRARHILTHGLSGSISEIEKVHSWMHRALIGAPPRVEDIGNSRRKGESIHQDIRLPHCGDGVLDLHATSMVMCLADEKHSS